MVLAPTAAYTWTAELNVQTHYRSSNRFYDGLNFVIRIIYPDNQISYDNGGRGAWGYYKTGFSHYSQCVDDETPPPAYGPASVDAVERL